MENKLKKKAEISNNQSPNQMNKLEQEMTELDRLIEEELLKNISLHDKLKNTEQELSDINKKFVEAISERNDVFEKYTKIQQSRSWRYTEPYRKSMAVVKYIFRLLKGNKQENHYQIIKQNQNKKKVRRIEIIKKKLYNFGFTERAYEDLFALYQYTTDNELKRLAAWELALWHANERNDKGAKKCLEFIHIVKENLQNEDLIRQVSIIEAECYELLGELENAKRVIQFAIAKAPHADLFLAAANLESNSSDRLQWINKTLQHYDIPEVTLRKSKDLSFTTYDNLAIDIKKGSNFRSLKNIPKVSIIIPAYNAEKSISTCLDSVLNQTWKNIEVLVVDDCSTDNTAEIVEKYVKKDSRVLLIKAKSNGGAYVARNLALQAATGDFVTVNDADDWSHSSKIERQVIHLINNPAVIGNSSQQARATESLKFDRRGNPGFYLFTNISSLMFRRKIVMDAIGYWDSVRFTADGEFIRRIKKVFGNEALVDLETGPLSFQRLSDNSLTGNKSFGYQGFLMGARKEYFDSYRYHHKNSSNLKYEFQQTTRPFPVPEPMLPIREIKNNDRRKFDVILVSDFRLAGGSNMSNVEEIIAQKEMGLRIGLIQMYRYDFDPNRPMNNKIRELIDGKQVQVIVYGEKVSCDLLILRYPPVLQEWQKYVPDVEAKNVHVIVNQPPKSDYGPEAVLRYNIPRAHQHIQEYFRREEIWFPIGPLVRNVLYEHHADELKAITLAKEDWSNIIDLKEWKRQEKPTETSKIKIGRHSRDHEVKWPESKETMLSIYPESEEYEIHVLGGAETPKSIIGYQPENWHVINFGEKHPKDFLKEIDVFVYYTHPNWVEAFGRVIIEAMAVGVPVILPYQYKELFEEAAIYAEPCEVKEKIDLLMKNRDFYEAQVKNAHKYIEKKFGYTMHAARLKNYGGVDVRSDKYLLSNM